MKYTKLTQKDYNNFFKYSTFGNTNDLLRASIMRAYRDFNRTISGFSKNKRHDIIFKNAYDTLYSQVSKLIMLNVKVKVILIFGIKSVVIS